MKRADNWVIAEYSHESLYGSYLWDMKIRRVIGTKDQVKDLIVSQMIGDDKKNVSALMANDSKIIVQIEGDEMIEKHRVIVAEPENLAEEL